MQQHDWSSTSPKEPMLHLSLPPCTGSRLQLASSSRHWCLHIKQPQAQHPPTSTHYYDLHPLQKPRLLPLTITNLHPLQKPRLLPLHYYESTSPPGSPPAPYFHFHYYELHPLQKPPRLLPLTDYESNIPSRSLPSYFHSLLRIYTPSRSPGLTSNHYFTNLHPLQNTPPTFHLTDYESTPLQKPPAYFHSLIYDSNIPSRSPPPTFHFTITNIHPPPEAPPTSNSLLRIFYIPSSKPRLLPLTYYESTPPPESPRLTSTSLLPNLHPLQKPRPLPLTITNLHPLQKPRLLPLTITNLHPLQKPRLLPLTITNLHPLQKPRLLPLTITNLHPLQKPRLLPLGFQEQADPGMFFHLMKINKWIKSATLLRDWPLLMYVLVFLLLWSCKWKKKTLKQIDRYIYFKKNVAKTILWSKTTMQFTQSRCESRSINSLLNK